MSPARILVVCTANICRSPMAERLLAEFLVRRAPDSDVFVSSAGTHARPGDPAASGMQRIATSWGLDLDYHRSRRVTHDLVAEQDLVLTMEDAHRTSVSRLAAGTGRRTFTITELVALSAAQPSTGEHPLVDQVAVWHNARARTVLDAPDVADPYGGPQAGYERTAWQLADLVERLGPQLLPSLSAQR